MYPLIYIIQDVHYLIYQHFSGKDFLRLLEVSKFCSEAVLNSNCMKKIKLVMKFENKDGRAKGEAINILKSTKRNYQYIEIDCENDSLLSKELREFLKRAGQFVVELKFENFIDDLLPEFHLPKLQSLTLVNVAAKGRYSILTKTNSLKTLKLETDKWPKQLKYPFKEPQTTRESNECLLRFIINNRQLEDLRIQGATHNHSFFTYSLWKETSFNLKSLNVWNTTYYSFFGETHQENFVKFIASQANSLKSVSIDICGSANDVIKNVVNILPNLTSLGLNLAMIGRLSDYNFNLGTSSQKFNEKIVDLKIQSEGLRTNYRVDIRVVLSFMPNLSSLFIENLNEEQTEYIVRNAKHLRTLSYRSKSDYDWASSFYNELKLKFPEANQNISIKMFPRKRYYFD